MKSKAAGWLRQGISPQRLALTLSLGFAIGCIPIVGVTTLVCIGLAMALRLNLPAITAANYAVMPLQVVLILPFVRLGGWLFNLGSSHAVRTASLIHGSPMALVAQFGSLAGAALVAWLLTAIPTIAILTLILTPLLRRVPALHAAESLETEAAA